MLSTSVGIISPVSTGGGNYTVSLFFSIAAIAQYVNVGDTMQDALGNQYSITTWVGFPSNFASGGTVTVSFITLDTLPNADAGFFSTFFTPGQVDFRSAVRTPGSIFNISVASGKDYEYEMEASWTISSEASGAEVGDSIVDATGKEYQITFLEPTKFALPFKAAEVLKEGISPSGGIGSLYRSTANLELYQGTELLDPNRTIVRNRDDFVVDQTIKSIQDSIASFGSGSALEITVTNDSGSTITKGTPVRIDSNGEIAEITISTEDHALAVAGVVKEDILDSATGIVVSSGVLADITTSATFDDQVWVSKTGTITEVKPDIGVGGFLAGDFVVSLGVIAKNKDTPANKDLIVRLQIVGQL